MRLPTPPVAPATSTAFSDGRATGVPEGARARQRGRSGVSCGGSRARTKARPCKRALSLSMCHCGISTSFDLQIRCSGSQKRGMLPLSLACNVTHHRRAGLPRHPTATVATEAR